MRARARLSSRLRITVLVTSTRKPVPARRGLQAGVLRVDHQSVKQVPVVLGHSAGRHLQAAAAQHQVGRTFQRPAGDDRADRHHRRRAVDDGLTQTGHGQNGADADNRIARADENGLGLGQRRAHAGSRAGLLNVLEDDLQNLLPAAALHPDTPGNETRPQGCE